MRRQHTDAADVEEGAEGQRDVALLDVRVRELLALVGEGDEVIDTAKHPLEAQEVQERHVVEVLHAHVRLGRVLVLVKVHHAVAPAGRQGRKRVEGRV